MEFTVEQIAQILNGEIRGDKTLKVKQLSKIEEGTDGSISFLANLKYEPFLYTTQASVVIVDKDFVPKKAYSPTLILVENAYASFTVLLQEYQKILSSVKIGIEQPSFIGKNSVIGEDIYLAAFSYIGDNCKIGKNTKIYPNVTISDSVTIGENCIIHTGAKIHNDTIIGNNCVIHSNAVIGGDGFGFAPKADGTFDTIPQLGNVILEDDVCVGSNTCVDRATMGSTILRKGVKLDNLVQIAHNVEVGENTVIAALAGISGSVKIGSNCMIGGQTGMTGHIKIANNTRVTAQTGISKTVKTEGLVLGGNPAIENRDYLKNHAYIRQIPKLEKRLGDLEKKISNE
jgi:UDP-3-O-[3-hydroxymyristoyl] glucosamine N-acyltransferase